MFIFVVKILNNMAIGMSYRPLSDMESNGVYFEREEDILDVPPLICEYSGLRSVAAYIDEEEHFVGHS